jgi:hypothetical protein
MVVVVIVIIVIVVVKLTIGLSITRRSILAIQLYVITFSILKIVRISIIIMLKILECRF